LNCDFIILIISIIYFTVSIGANSEGILQVDVTQNLPDIVATLSRLLEPGNTFGTGQGYYTFISCCHEKYWLQNKGPQSSFSIFYFTIKAIRELDYWRQRMNLVVTSDLEVGDSSPLDKQL